jgi:hypothetical protein
VSVWEWPKVQEMLPTNDPLNLPFTKSKKAPNYCRGDPLQSIKLQHQ